MAAPPWAVGDDVARLIEQVKQKHHEKRLEMAEIAACFTESKPFTPDGRFNWGRVRKFNAMDKLWHQRDKEYDFLLVICSDAWHSVLGANEREAYIDLMLTRCTADYKPVEVVENGKPKKVKDKWGRLEFSEEFRCDEAGNPIWKVAPLDIVVFAMNAKRYGLWHEDLIYMGDVVRHGPQAAGAAEDRQIQTDGPFVGSVITPNAECEFQPNE